MTEIRVRQSLSDYGRDRATDQAVAARRDAHHAARSTVDTVNVRTDIPVPARATTLPAWDVTPADACGRIVLVSAPIDDTRRWLGSRPHVGWITSGYHDGEVVVVLPDGRTVVTEPSQLTPVSDVAPFAAREANGEHPADVIGRY